MHRYLKASALLSIGLLASLSANAQQSGDPSPVTAIDILLEPDATMVKNAEAANERLLKISRRASLWARRINRTSRPCSGT